LLILGIDPGSRVCGYGVVSASAPGDARGDLAYVECGVLTAPDEWPMERRLGEIARLLTEVIAELRPTVVAVEDVFTHVNVRSALALAQARGAALAVVGLAGLAVASYSPALVKKTVVGSGRADKDQVARMVQALIGLRTAPRSDAADALAIAITHAQVSRGAAVMREAVLRAGGRP
jgi:crossover junction endodeoxyribonuclease RuvC